MHCFVARNIHVQYLLLQATAKFITLHGNKLGSKGIVHVEGVK